MPADAVTSPSDDVAAGVDLRGALAAAERQLAAAGVESARFDAAELAAHVLGVERGRLVTAPALTREQVTRYTELVRRRADREPLQHLTGVAGFRHLDLAVGPGVFVPRPETESMVQWCLEALSAQPRPLVVDLCSGSGAIALAIADEHPGAVVHAVEREPAAYAWLQRNAGDRERVRLHLADASAALPDLVGRVDLVVSNPPYLPERTAVDLEPEVRDHDPAAALWGGPDGLDGLRMVEPAARRLLRPGGLLAVEHDDSHGESAPDLLRDAGGWARVAGYRDLAQRPRYVTAQWWS